MKPPTFENRQKTPAGLEPRVVGLVDWLVGWVGVGWLVGWCVFGWLVGRSVGCAPTLTTHPFTHPTPRQPKHPPTCPITHSPAHASGQSTRVLGGLGVRWGYVNVWVGGVGWSVVVVMWRCGRVCWLGHGVLRSMIGLCFMPLPSDPLRGGCRLPRTPSGRLRAINPRPPQGVFAIFSLLLPTLLLARRRFANRISPLTG